MTLATLRTLVASAGGELAEKAVVVRALATLGHKTGPSVVQVKTTAGLTRVYVFAFTPLGTLALVTGRDVEPALYTMRPWQKGEPVNELVVTTRDGSFTVAGTRAQEATPTRENPPLKVGSTVKTEKQFTTLPTGTILRGIHQPSKVALRTGETWAMYDLVGEDLAGAGSMTPYDLVKTGAAATIVALGKGVIYGAWTDFIREKLNLAKPAEAVPAATPAPAAPASVLFSAGSTIDGAVANDMAAHGPRRALVYVETGRHAGKYAYLDGNMQAWYTWAPGADTEDPVHAKLVFAKDTALRVLIPPGNVFPGATAINANIDAHAKTLPGKVAATLKAGAEVQFLAEIEALPVGTLIRWPAWNAAKHAVYAKMSPAAWTYGEVDQGTWKFTGSTTLSGAFTMFPWIVVLGGTGKVRTAEEIHEFLVGGEAPAKVAPALVIPPVGTTITVRKEIDALPIGSVLAYPTPVPKFAYVKFDATSWSAWEQVGSAWMVADDIELGAFSLDGNNQVQYIGDGTYPADALLRVKQLAKSWPGAMPTSVPAPAAPAVAHPAVGSKVTFAQVKALPAGSVLRAGTWSVDVDDGDMKLVDGTWAQGSSYGQDPATGAKGYGFVPYHVDSTGSHSTEQMAGWILVYVGTGANLSAEVMGKIVHGYMDKSAALAGDPGAPPATKLPFDLGVDATWEQVGGVHALYARCSGVAHGPALGSNKGGKIIDPVTGQAFYRKWAPSLDHGRNEVLAARLYRATGLYAPDLRGVAVDGTLVLYSPWKVGLEQPAKLISETPSWTQAERHVLATQFPVDAWLANYDVAGEGTATPWDNLLRNTEVLGSYDVYRLFRVDVGASLAFRGTGATKSKHNQDYPSFGDDASIALAQWFAKNTTVSKTFDHFLAEPALGKEMIERIDTVPAKTIESAATWAGFDKGTAFQYAETLITRSWSLVQWAKALDAKPAAKAPPGDTIEWPAEAHRLGHYPVLLAASGEAYIGLHDPARLDGWTPLTPGMAGADDVDLSPGIYTVIHPGGLDDYDAASPGKVPTHHLWDKLVAPFLAKHAQAVKVAKGAAKLATGTAKPGDTITWPAEAHYLLSDPLLLAADGKTVFIGTDDPAENGSWNQVSPGKLGGPTSIPAGTYTVLHAGGTGENDPGNTVGSQVWDKLVVPALGKPATLTQSAGCVVINHLGEVLLREPTGHYGGYGWTWPKGGIDVGESLWDAAIRETR
ncbi:MAG: NUDIX hydrolase, partial [Gemmatimonadales bacterium]|nr:NUDIX hydrolase [Gemmatimonadales bacterium]